MIKHIIFDMGGIILPMNSVELPTERFAQIGLPEQVARECFCIYGQQGIFRDCEAGRLSVEGFLSAYKELTGYAATFDEIEWAWLGFVQDVPEERLLWLRQLRSEGYDIVLLSNTNPFIQHYIESPAFSQSGLGIQHYFDRIFYSYDLGECKPAPIVFQRMLEQGGYRADECLFLDDALHNVESARQCGLHAIHVPDNQPWLAPLREALTPPQPSPAGEGVEKSQSTN